MELNIPEMVNIYVTCGDCRGRGHVTGEAYIGTMNSPYADIALNCPTCDGEREVSLMVCSHCERVEATCTCVDELEAQLAVLAADTGEIESVIGRAA